LLTGLLRGIQQEIRRHDFSHFVDEPPSVAQGGRGVVVAGCPACKKRINTMTKFLDHLAEDEMPTLIEKLSVDAKQSCGGDRMIQKEVQGVY
jgi:hypothetical protein